jgi:flagellar basal-body rod modification protein FlgD
MEITASTASPAAASSAARDRIGLADDFDSFLQLLTTQLKNQDPLSPLDANQFTEQLVQFSAVEQAIKSNDVLGQLLAVIRGDQIARSVDYIGAEVEAAGQTVQLGAGGTGQVHYRLDRAAAAVRIDIYDSGGRLVASRQGDTGLGSHSVAWDGRSQSGAALPDGLYRVEVVASDAAGQAVPVTTTIRGLVDGVEIDGDRVLLSINGVLMPLESITAIYRPQPAA